MHYKLYFLDGRGRILRGQDIECDDDGQAEEAARAHGHGYVVEVWQRARLVARIEPA